MDGFGVSCRGSMTDAFRAIDTDEVSPHNQQQRDLVAAHDKHTAP